MKTASHIFSLIVVVCIFTACSKNELDNIEPKQNTGIHKSGTLPSAIADQPDVEGLTAVRVFFNWHSFTVMINRVIDEPVVFRGPEKREPNEFFVYNEESTVKYRPIISALSDPGSYMLWREMKIEFNPGFRPRQFYSRDEVMEASQAPNAVITLTPTGVVYQGRKFNAVESQPVTKPLTTN